MTAADAAPSGPGGPISSETFIEALAPLRGARSIALCVSGGRDSMALLRLAAAVAPGLGLTLRAFIVDHGLREGSAAEARQAAAWCEASGVKASMLQWTGEKPASGVQAAARKARYRLIAEVAVTWGADMALTGHTADDQAETVLMRLKRGSGPVGLAGMARESRFAAGAGAPLRLLRPLLAFSRRQTKATADAFGQPFIDDPGNENPEIERIAARRQLKDGRPDAFVSKRSLLDMAARMRRASKRLDAADRDALRASAGLFTRWGGAVLSLRDCAPPPGALAARLARAVSGADYAPDDVAMAQALGSAITTGTATLGGAMIRRTSGKLWFFREPAAILGRAGVDARAPLHLKPGQTALWDGRFVVAAGRSSIEVKPLGEAGLAALGPASALAGAPADALQSAPGIYHQGRLIGAPGVLFRQDVDFTVRPLVEERFLGGIVRYW